MAALDDCLASLQNFELRPLDINLHHSYDAFAEKIIEAHALDNFSSGRARFDFSKLCRAEVSWLPIIRNLEHESAILLTACVGKCPHVCQAIQCQVGAELLEDDWLRFEGIKGTAFLRQGCGQRYGVDAHIRSDLDYEPRLFRQSQQKVQLELRTLSVDEKRLSHEVIIAIHQHCSVPGFRDFIGRCNRHCSSADL